MRVVLTNVMYYIFQKDDDDKELNKKVDTDVSASTVSNNGISSPSLQQSQQQQQQLQQSPASNQLPSKVEDTETNTVKENNKPKRLYISNVPFRFRDADLRAMCSVSISIH